jgi:hypothetical protein
MVHIRLHEWRRWAAVGTSIGALVVLATGVAAAQPPGPGQPPPGGQPRDGGRGPFSDDFADRLAQNLGVSSDAVRTALQEIRADMPARPDFPSGGPGSGGPGNPPPGGSFGPGGPPPDGTFPPRPGGQGGTFGPPDASQRPFPPMMSDLADRLAAKLGLSVDTVRAALDQTFQQQGPPPGPSAP